MTAPKRRLVSVDTVVKEIVGDEVRALFAQDVIAGRVVHNVATDVFMLREFATEEFLAEATEAYRLKVLGGERR